MIRLSFGDDVMINDIAGDYIFKGTLSFSDWSVLGKPVYERFTSSSQYSLFYNSEVESWWLGDNISTQSPLIKCQDGTDLVCPADHDHIWSRRTEDGSWVQDPSITLQCLP